MKKPKENNQFLHKLGDMVRTKRGEGGGQFANLKIMAFVNGSVVKG